MNGGTALRLEAAKRARKDAFVFMPAWPKVFAPLYRRIGRVSGSHPHPHFSDETDD
jgi:hypothetical protein